MPYSRRRNHSQSSMSTGSNQHAYVNASKASLHPCLELSGRRNSYSAAREESSSLDDDFLAIDYNEELLGEASVEVTYPSTMSYHPHHHYPSKNNSSVAWKDFEEPQSYNNTNDNHNKHTVSTPSTEPMFDSDEDSFGQPLTPQSPPPVGDWTNHASFEDDDFAGSGCFDNPFPYLGQRMRIAPAASAAAPTTTERHVRKIDPDGQLARNLCLEDFSYFAVNRSLPPAETIPQDAKEEPQHDDGDEEEYDGIEFPYLGQVSTLEQGDEDNDSIPESLLTTNEPTGGCAFPYLGRHDNGGDDHNKNDREDDDSFPDSLLSPATSRDSSDDLLAASGFPFLCRGAAPLSPMSAVMEEKKNEDDNHHDDMVMKAPAGCLFSAPLNKQIHDDGQDDFEYSVSSQESQPGAPEQQTPIDVEPNDELLSEIHGHVGQCVESFGIISSRTGKAWLQMGMACMKDGRNLEMAQRAFCQAYNAFQHKPVARALVLEKMSQAASLQANADASLLPQVQTLLLESFRLRQDHLGKLHVDTVDTLNQMARFHRRSGDLQEARRLHAQVFYARRQIFGSLHPSCAVAANDVANILVQLGQLKEAKKFYHVALTVYEQMHVPLENPAVSRLVKDVRQMQRVEKGVLTKSTMKLRPLTGSSKSSINAAGAYRR